METQYTKEQLTQLYYEQSLIEQYYAKMTEAEYYDIQNYCNDF